MAGVPRISPLFPVLRLVALLLITLPCTCVFAQSEVEPELASAFPARTEWLEKWDNSLAYTLETLERVAEADLDFRPTEDQMTLREQFHHLATNVYFLTSRYLGQPDTFDLAAARKAMQADADKAAVARTLREAFAFGATACRALAEADWETPAPDFFAGPKTKRTILYLIQDHATHHRAQTLVYLRLLGHEPPSYRGW